MNGDREKRGILSMIPTIVACIIVVVWVVLIMVDMVDETYDPHPSITPVMLGASGFLFSKEFVGRWKQNGQSHSANGKE